MGATPRTNRSAKGGARSSPHYGGEGVLIHPPHQGVCGRHGTLTVSVRAARLGWFGEAAGASGQTRDEGDGNASSDGGDRVLHVALRSDGQPLADGNLGVGQVS